MYSRSYVCVLMHMCVCILTKIFTFTYAYLHTYNAQETNGENFRKLLASAVEISGWTQKGAICNVAMLIPKQDTRSDSDPKALCKYHLLPVKIPTAIGNWYYSMVSTEAGRWNEIKCNAFKGVHVKVCSSNPLFKLCCLHNVNKYSFPNYQTKLHWVVHFWATTLKQCILCIASV